MDAQEGVVKKLKEGWIQTIMMIEVMAVSEEAARSSLEKHVAAMEKEKKTLIGRKDYKEIKRIENPRPNIPEAYSYIVEVEVLAHDMDTLVYLAMNYAPSSIEIIRPEKLSIDAGEAQGILNSIADLIHKFAQQGIGGVVIRS